MAAAFEFFYLYEAEGNMKQALKAKLSLAI